MDQYQFSRCWGLRGRHLKITGGGSVNVNQYGLDGQGYIGYLPGSTGLVTVDGNGSKWTCSEAIYVGSIGTGALSVTNGGAVSGLDLSLSLGNGTLNIASGGTVSDVSGSVAAGAASAGIAAVDGNGSTWTNAQTLYIGNQGNGTLNVTHGGSVVSQKLYVGNSSGSSFNGTLNIASGGTVSDTSGYVAQGFGFSGSQTGTVTVTGAGSLWSNSGNLTVGNGSGTGTLNICGGGGVTAASVLLYPGSLLGIDVGNSSSLTVGNGSGKLTNGGTVRLLAGAGATAGQQSSPISAATWNDSGGTYQALGGTWNDTTHQFTVSATQSGTAGQQLTIDLENEQRGLVSDSVTGWSVGASFLSSTVSKPLSLTATTIGGSNLASLQSLLTPQQSVLGGWEFAFASGYTDGDPAYLSFGIGSGYSQRAGGLALRRQQLDALYRQRPDL